MAPLVKSLAHNLAMLVIWIVLVVDALYVAMLFVNPYSGIASQLIEYSAFDAQGLMWIVALMALFCGIFFAANVRKARAAGFAAPAMAACYGAGPV